MTISIPKGLALCGACALLAGIGSAAFAQGDYARDGFHHAPMSHARYAVLRQKEAYARAVANGHYGAAERAHLRAQAIRHHIRVRREMSRHHEFDHHDGFDRDRGY